MTDKEASKSKVEKRSRRPKPADSDAGMNRSAPNIQALAERLIGYEAIGSTSSETNVPAALNGVVKKLRPLLAALTGEVGAAALLSRALALANAKVGWLGAVHLNTNGSLECSANMTHVDKGEIAEGEVAVVSSLLELLVTFIGERLTLRLVQDAWPTAHR